MIPMTESVKNCPNCGSEARSDVLSDYGRTIKKCSGCGLMYVTPRPSEESVRDYFANEYIVDESSLGTHFTSHRARSLKREADIVKRLVPTGGKLLDVGAASGYFLAEFAQDNMWNVIGVEPSPMAAKSGSERYSIEIRSGFVADQSFSGNSFDVVTSLDAFILHLNVHEDLIEFQRVLKPGGFLVFEIPGLRYRFLKGTGLFAKILYQRKTRINLPLHNFYFTSRTLKDLVARRGFTFVMSEPERSPVYGNSIMKILNWAYYSVAALLYRASAGRIHFAPKELLVFRKC